MSWRCASAITRYQEGTERIPAIRLRWIFRRRGNFATNCGSRGDQIAICSLLAWQGTV